MLDAMTGMAKNVELILNGKRKNLKFIGNTQGGFEKLKNPLKCRAKGISNARLKSHWEKRKCKKKKLADHATTIESCSLVS
ncbi:hypothetical protein IEQ34_017147 [Dendrobium chrysotoxum]|uniref:Uncharacterized protein n=1 Tax=Dendrobium chrysotoxum TaxID=161865 RepID=A0AAV7GBS3_DENCH|nr:hypothetical protein IEQ34_017147 [Dendrobium chrysotoxum]